METVMRLVMCNWTWNLFCPKNIQTRLGCISLGKSPQTFSAHSSLKGSSFFSAVSTGRGTRLSCFSPNVQGSCTFLLCPTALKKTPNPQSTPTLLSHKWPHPRCDWFVLWNFHYMNRIKIQHAVNLWLLWSCHWKHKPFQTFALKPK